MISGELLDEARRRVDVPMVLGLRAWPGLRCVGGGMYALFSRSGVQKLYIQDSLRWYDPREGQVHDAFDLLCLLRGSSEEWVASEFVGLASQASGPEPVVGALATEPLKAGEESAQPVRAVRPEDTVQKSAAETNAENGALPQSKRKGPADLLALIPRGDPILQADLFKMASAAGINEKYARRFLHCLISEKLVSVQKLPRETAKSALGYVLPS
jgi:hypothetical protein